MSSVHPIASGPTRGAGVADRIARRIEVLRGWRRDGLPDDTVIPTSLAELRRWSAPELGILPIASPNEFTRSHPLHGSAVREAGRLIEELLARHARPAPRRPTRGNPSERRPDVDARLLAAVEQWHAERAARLEAEARLASANALVSVLRRENAERDGVIADLTTRLAGRDGLRAIR